MPDDEDHYSSAAKTARSTKAVGHSASGGHAAPRTSALSKANRPQWQTDRVYDDGRSNDPVTAYSEYPKHIYPDCPGGVHDGTSKRFVVVRNADEEALALGDQPIVRDDDERKRLLAVAEVNNVNVDGRWSLKRIAQTITDAGFDATLNPFA